MGWCVIRQSLVWALSLAVLTVAPLGCTTSIEGESASADGRRGRSDPDAEGSDGSPGRSDGGPGEDAGAGLGVTPDGLVPLYDESTELEPALVEMTEQGLVTRFSDRARDRHAREDKLPDFRRYEHYLHLYWKHRTAEIEIVDTVPKGGSTITFNVVTQWKLDDFQAELRAFYRGLGTVAEYHNNASMTALDDTHYTRTIDYNSREGRPLRVGDLMEFEMSQFLDAPPEGRDNYYGTTFLYVVGRGLVPWIAEPGPWLPGEGAIRDSYPIPDQAWLGGETTIHHNESHEPQNVFLQMATNTGPHHAQPFMLGRRAIHTSFVDGSHDESDLNPVWTEQAAKAAPRYINASCSGCHVRNGRSLAPEAGVPLSQHVFKVGDAEGDSHPMFGSVLQPSVVGSAAKESAVSIARWQEVEGGLRRPVYAFEGVAPSHHSARVSPALIGLGLLEAIAENDIVSQADPNDANGDGISGRVRVVEDPETGVPRLGRFGWKAGAASVRHQVAGALRTDMGVLSSVWPMPDCGAAQTDCGESGAEIDEEMLENMSVYTSLVGVHAQRASGDAQVQRGQAVFEQSACTACHTPRYETSAFHPFAELRSQAIQPYTDLLLHDMGPGLADNLGEGALNAGNASGAEWRTPPLWNIGLSEGVSGEAQFLHDGRARSLDEAIRWHGGEAELSRMAYEALSEADREALIAFLQSL